jgi:hypothetical protein
MLWSAAIRLAKGTWQTRQLNRQIKAMGALVRREPFQLIPSGFRGAARVKLKAAQKRAGVKAIKAGEIAHEAEVLRKETLQMVMQRAAQEPATKEDMARVVQTLDIFTKGAGEEIESVRAEAAAGRDDLDRRLELTTGELQAMSAVYAEQVGVLRKAQGAADARIGQCEQSIGKAEATCQQELRVLRNSIEAVSAEVANVDANGKSAATELRRSLTESEANLQALGVGVERKFDVVHVSIEVQGEQFARQTKALKVGFVVLALAQAVELVYLLARR